MSTKKVIIIDSIVEFCMALGSVFTKEGCEFYYTDRLEEALKLIQSKLPDVILADKNLHKNLESSLHNIIDTSGDYDPDVIIYDHKTKGFDLANEVLKIFGR